MAALVSEYTLEFFTLLNARGKKELIEWCMKEGLIASSYECPKCDEPMRLNERKSVVLDGFEWRCRKKGVNTHDELAASKTIRREIDLFEDEGFRGKYLEKVYRALLTVPPTSVDVERAFSTADGHRFNSCQVIYSQLGLAIHQNDHQARRRFVEWAQNEIAVVPDFHKRILFTDEVHFWLNGYVNKQNCRIWSEANPQVYVETPLHPEKLTVWCALWASGIIGPYFFKNDEGHNVTVNGDRYRAMITNFFIPELKNHDVQELWFQQDGATCHTARATIDLLKDTFGDRLISRFGPVNWPPRSCDLTPLDYFLWGYVKSLVYADKPQTLDHLEDNIRRVIANIRPQMLEKVIENWTSRLDYIRASRGSPMPEIIFKM
ncbi:transposable element Tc3 transposase [Trichonephila clavipes]|nr:transposable element Tc3 transposase [Trichonephila clavipes]